MLLHKIDFVLVIFVVGLSTFLSNIHESSLYTILPKYLRNHSYVEVSNQTSFQQFNISRNCATPKPRYVLVSMIFLVKIICIVIINPIAGIVAERINKFIILIFVHVLGVTVSLIYGFGDSILLYVIGRILDAFVLSCNVIAILCLISQLFPNIIIRNRLFGYNAIIGNISISIGPVYGAKVDGKFGKYMVYVILVPLWFLCGLLTVILFWKTKMNAKKEVEQTKNNEANSTELITEDTGSLSSPPISIPARKGRKDGANRNNFTGTIMQIWKILKDKIVLLGLIHTVLTALTLSSLAPTLPSWMAFELCANESQQGMVWSFGFLGHIMGIVIILLINRYASHLLYIIPILGGIILAIVMITLPFIRDWRLIMISIIGTMLILGIYEQVFIQLFMDLAKTRHSNNYGIMSSLLYQSVRLGTLSSLLISGYISERFGFRFLAIALGVMNILISPVSFVYRKFFVIKKI